MNTNITGVILCGGQSKRMGADKSAMRFGGSTLLKIAHDKLSQLCDSVVISGNLRQPGMKGVPDIKLGDGPADGILSCLKHCETSILAVPCDAPLVPSNYLQYLLDHYDPGLPATLTSHFEKREPLCGIFTQNSVPYIEKALSAGEYSVVKICDTMNTKWVPANEVIADYSPHLFMNVNTPADADALRKIIPDE